MCLGAIFIFTILASNILGASADQCSDPPVWLVVLDAIVPFIGILASGSYFITVRCCTNHCNKKILQKILRYISLVNFFVLLASITLLVLSCEKVLAKVPGLANITEWVFGGVMFFSWVVMVSESFICRERRYIKRLAREQEIIEKIQEFKDKQPKIFWTAVGYNMVDKQVPVRTVHLPCSTPQVKFSEDKVGTQTSYSVSNRL